MVQFDWTMLDKVGIGGVTVVVVYFGFKLVALFIKQWEVSTEAINRNSKSFENLSTVFEKQSIREVEFQRDVLSMLNDGSSILKDTHKKVSDLHESTFTKRMQ